MARQPVRDISAPAAITPRASPVNTYVRPADPAPSNLHQLASGLAAFDDGLSGFLAKRNKEKDDADKIRGAAAFNQNNQTGWSEAVKKGLVSPHSSPVFMEAYKKSQGNLAGIRLREEFNSAYLQWEGRNSNDPEAFQNFLGGFIKERVQTEDVDVLRGLTPHLETLTEDAYAVFGKERGASAYSGSVNTRAAVSGETIDYANSSGLASEIGTDYAALQQDLLDQRAEALASGIRHEDYDKQLVKTITTKAIEHGDPALLDLLDVELDEYGGQKLSSLPDYSSIKQTTLEALETDARQREVDRDKRQAKLDKAAEDKVVRGVMDSLAEDPMAEIPEEAIREWSKYDPMARTKLETARKTLLDANTAEDPEDILMIERMIQEGATTADLFEMVNDGTIRDPGTLRTALDRMEKRRTARLKGDGILTSQTAKRLLSTIKERTTPDELMGGMFAPDGLTDEGLEATKDFEMMLIQWEEQNPDATLMDREKFLNEAGEIVLRRITEEDRQYISPADAEAMRREAEAAATPPAEQEAQSGADAGDQEADAEPSKSFWSLPTKKQWQKALEIDAGIGRPTKSNTEAYNAWAKSKAEEYFSGDEPPAFKDMDRPYRLKIEEDAAKLGMDPEELTVKMWQKLNEAVNGATEPAEKDPHAETVEDNLQKSSLTVPEDASGSIAATIDQAVENGTRISAKTASAEPEAQKVSPILDLIGQTEGTDRGRGYNETLGYGAYTGGDVELTSMTLGDIDKLQTKMLRHPKNTLNSSALGRYQIVRTTLRSLKNKMGLKDDDVFTPELQDKMALALLGGRGLDRWAAGKMSDKSFMNALSREWASLPTASGKGYYDGQRTGTTPDGVLSAFQTIRGLGGSDGQQAINAALSGGGGEQNIFKQYENAKLDQVVTADDRGYAPDIDNVADDVKTRLVSLQKAFGKALPVVSGFRDTKRNAKAGGAKKSQHTHGNAVDISVKGMPQEERVRLIRMASEAGFTGIGVYDNSLHFDIGRRRYWGPSFRSASLPPWAKEAIKEHMERTA